MRSVLNKTLVAAMAFLLIWSLPGQNANACPCCCYMPILTFTDQMKREDVAVIVTLQSSRLPSGVEGDVGSTTYKIIKVQYTSTQSTLKPGDIIQLGHYEEGLVGDPFLTMGTCRNNYDVSAQPCNTKTERKRIDTSHLTANDFVWSSPISAPDNLIGYLENISVSAESIVRLKYYLQHLESPNPHVADDAFTEISRLTYPELVELAPYMNREKLRGYIIDKNTPITRIGHFGVMLGLCGNESDAQIMEERIRIEGEGFRMGIDGIMKGYLLLTKENGLQLLGDTKLKQLSGPETEIVFSECYAALQAIRFAADEMGQEEISQDKVKEAMHLVLVSPDLADLAIFDLARWEDWTVAERLLEMFHDERFDLPAVKKSIVYYFLALLDTDHHKVSCPSDALVERAKEFINELEVAKPSLVRHARNIYR